MKYIKFFEGYFGDGYENGYLSPKIPNPHVPSSIFDGELVNAKIIKKRQGYKYKKLYILTVQIDDVIKDIEVEQNDYHNHKIGGEIKINQNLLKEGFFQIKS